MLMYRSMKCFLPEDSVLRIGMPEGGHCRPDDPAERVRAYGEFIIIAEKTPASVSGEMNRQQVRPVIKRFVLRK